MSDSGDEMGTELAATVVLAASGGALRPGDGPLSAYLQVLREIHDEVY
jgi:hypothetical protein